MTGATQTPERSISAGESTRHGGRVWLVFADMLANRIFFECGIVDRLEALLPGRLTAVFLADDEHVERWRDRLGEIPVLDRRQLLIVDVSERERAARRLDAALDRRFGFYPLAVRHSLRHGFHEGRWSSKHTNPFLDSARVGPLPHWRAFESLMARWHLSAWRHVAPDLLRRMRSDRAALVLTNPQAHASMPFLTAARRLDAPAVGYIASWDHPVGKGIVSPYLERYVVQNEIMKEDLRRFHGIPPSRVVVTGWPQTDAYHERSPRELFEELLGRLGLPPDRPVLLFAGNTPQNAPYEDRLVARLVSWWQEAKSDRRVSLVFRPHPYDREVRHRYAAAFDAAGVAVQTRTYDDFDDLVTLLQHVDCVVANAGTILLEAIVNDRPSVCVTFDEGAPPGRAWAGHNLTGEHYRAVLGSDAFYRVGSFEELVEAVSRALDRPQELRAERERVSSEVVGVVDGRAAERVAAAIADALARVPVQR